MVVPSERVHLVLVCACPASGTLPLTLTTSKVRDKYGVLHIDTNALILLDTSNTANFPVNETRFSSLYLALQLPIIA